MLCREQAVQGGTPSPGNLERLAILRDMDAHDRAVEDKSRACVVAWVQAVLPWAG